MGVDYAVAGLEVAGGTPAKFALRPEGMLVVVSKVGLAPEGDSKVRWRRWSVMRRKIC